MGKWGGGGDYRFRGGVDGCSAAEGETNGGGGFLCGLE